MHRSIYTKVVIRQFYEFYYLWKVPYSGTTMYGERMLTERLTVCVKETHKFIKKTLHEW